jgi:hypothetical protein
MCPYQLCSMQTSVYPYQLSVDSTVSRPHRLPACAYILSALFATEFYGFKALTGRSLTVRVLVVHIDLRVCIHRLESVWRLLGVHRLESVCIHISLSV